MDDLISKKAAIDYFVINVGFHDEDGYPIEDTDELRKIWTEYFDGIPSAEPKRGKWESQSDGGYCCSLCGRYAMDKADGRIVMISVKSRFCPNCGAEMEVTT